MYVTCIPEKLAFVVSAESTSKLSDWFIDWLTGSFFGWLVGCIIDWSQHVSSDRPVMQLLWAGPAKAHQLHVTAAAEHLS